MGSDHNIWYSGLTITLDVAEVARRLEAHPELADKELEDSEPTAPITLYEGKTMSHAVLRTRLKRLAARGLRATDAARQLGVSPSTVRNIYNDPNFRTEALGMLNNAFEDVDTNLKKSLLSTDEELELGAAEALHGLLSLMRDSEALTINQKIKVYTEMMDRGNITNRKSTSYSGTVDEAKLLSAETLARNAQAAAEMEAARKGKLTQLKRSA